MLNLNKCKKN